MLGGTVVRAGGTTVQAASTPRINSESRIGRAGKRLSMWVILLEAAGALVLLLLIVWWIMFSGRRAGERIDPASGRRPDE
jgi:hypothetical protein